MRKAFSIAATIVPGLGRMREHDASMIGKDNSSVWLQDPLAHPVLRAMSQRELADLPMEYANLGASRPPSRDQASSLKRQAEPA